MRTREEQIKALTRRMRWDAKRDAEAYIEEAEARGAAEQRRKDAEGQEPVAWGDFAFMKKGQPFTAYLKPPHADPKFNLPLYTRPANIVALESRIAELKEAEQHARADAEASKARVKMLEADAARFVWVSENTGCFWFGLPGFGPESGRTYEDRMKALRSAIDKNMVRAALKREGEVRCAVSTN